MTPPVTTLLVTTRRLGFGASDLHGQRGAAGPVNADVNAETALARASERPVRSSRCKMPLKTTN